MIRTEHTENADDQTVVTTIGNVRLTITPEEDCVAIEFEDIDQPDQPDQPDFRTTVRLRVDETSELIGDLVSAAMEVSDDVDSIDDAETEVLQKAY